jgi:3-deoxy-D-manno-octulosonate 8-phosphate phosphatase (KDO 8-P phosphatase)
MIKYLVMDVDGTLTDGKIYMGITGEACKAFNIKDGYGICHLLPTHNILPIIITGRSSSILEKRCLELGITELYQGISDKKELLVKLTKGELDEVAYIGDDLNDLECMIAVHKAGGIVGCPKDAAKKVREISDFVSNLSGGDGAVREFIEWLGCK